MADAPIDRDAIKAHYVAERGYWRPWNDALLRHNPAFLQRYADYAGHPARTGPLSERMVELIYVALDASATHLFPTGLQLHMQHALAVGARPEEIFDVLHLVTCQGLASVCAASAILVEEVGLASVPDGGSPLHARAKRLLPVPAPWLDAVSSLSPGYAQVLLDFLEHGRPPQGLSEPDRLVIEVALHACFTGFQADAVRDRIRAALAAGVVPAALLQAIQLGAHLSVHGAALGAGTFAGLPGQG